jgi:hypothetical protein
LLSEVQSFSSEANLNRGRRDLRRDQERVEKKELALQADRLYFEHEQKAQVQQANEDQSTNNLSVYLMGMHKTHQVTASKYTTVSENSVVEAEYNCGELLWSVQGPTSRIVKSVNHPYWLARTMVRYLKNGNHLSTEGSTWYKADIEPHHPCSLIPPHKGKPMLWSWFAGIQDELAGVDPISLLFGKALSNVPLVPEGKEYEEFEVSDGKAEVAADDETDGETEAKAEETDE